MADLILEARQGRLAFRLVPATLARELWRLAPGLALTTAIAAAAGWLHHRPGLGSLSPLILAIIIGTVLHNAVGTPAPLRPGIAFSLRRILRLAIILLGLQLTTEQVIEVGGGGLAIIATTLLATLTFTIWLGRRLGVEQKLAQLIGVGTSICGASAVIAANLVTEGSDEDVAYAVACVTVFGSLSMLLYPALSGVVGLDPHGFGLWTGASIHEIAQVVAAAFQDGREAGDFATIAKLSRVMLLAPVVIGLGVLAGARRRGDRQGVALRRVPVPWFVLGFVTMIGVNSLDIVPAAAKGVAVQATGFLLAMALAAMGLETSLRKLAAKGVRPFLLAAGAWAFIALFSLALIRCFY